MSDFRPVYFVVGLMIAALGLAMFAPMIVDYLYQDRSWQTFGVSGALTMMFGVALAIINYTPKPDLRSRGAFLLTVMSWFALSAFAALPFIMSPMKMELTDALFEATSGITTTGATVLTGLDNLPKGILLWRAILQWIGGVGIIVTAMAVLPMLKVGGMQLFRLESSDMGEKLLPQAASIAAWISGIYLILTLLCLAGYMMTGMNGFDATAHAMTTVATGGYSTSDASMGGFMDDGADIVCMIFMMAGAMPFGVYLLMLKNQAFAAPFRDPQVRAFVAVIVSLIALVTFYLWGHSELTNSRALRLSAFNVISIVTGTGYATADYGQWGAFAVACFFVFMFIGGCAGSTACSIKIFRYQVALAGLKAYLFQMPQPNAISPMRYAGRPLSPTVVYSVMTYFFVFLLTFATTAVILSLMGVDSLTAWSGAGSAVANVGPGLGEIIGPAGTYQDLSSPAKWVLMIAMIIGRLEIITAFVILMPSFWRA